MIVDNTLNAILKQLNTQMAHLRQRKILLERLDWQDLDTVNQAFSDIQSDLNLFENAKNGFTFCIKAITKSGVYVEKIGFRKEMIELSTNCEKEARFGDTKQFFRETALNLQNKVIIGDNQKVIDLDN